MDTHAETYWMQESDFLHPALITRYGMSKRLNTSQVMDMVFHVHGKGDEDM